MCNTISCVMVNGDNVIALRTLFYESKKKLGLSEMKDMIAILLGVACFILIIFAAVEYSKYNDRKFDKDFQITIVKHSDGYDVYKHGKLMFEFTKQNTDSMSLETLKMIFEAEL